MPEFSFFSFHFTRVCQSPMLQILLSRFRVRLNARDCLPGCKHMIVDNAACRRQLNRPWSVAR